MEFGISLTALEQRLIGELFEALHFSKDLRSAADSAYAALRRLISVDYGLLCITLSGEPVNEGWLVADVASDLSAVYPEVEHHDFVSPPCVSQPNVVLRDMDMLTHRAMKRNAMYHRFREIGMPVECVMGVMYAVESGWHGGIILFRSSNVPFLDHDRDLLQSITPIFAAGMRNFLRFELSAAMEAVLSRKGIKAILVDAAAKVIFCTAGVDNLLARWFSITERNHGNLPIPLGRVLTRLAAAPPFANPSPPPWVRKGPTGELWVDFIHVPMSGQWVLDLCEKNAASPMLPPGWAIKLTPRQLEVVELVLRGWDNALIAHELNCTVGTIKKHLLRVYDALGVPSRAALLSLAARVR